MPRPVPRPHLPGSPALLPPDLPARAASAGPAPGSRLWLCLHLPELSLEVQDPSPGKDGPRAVWAGEGRRALIITANGPARELGVHPGLPLNGALARVPRLDIHPRRPDLEAAALARLAGWAGRFTPTVVIEPAGALLLEVRGSLRLFNGLEALRAAVAGEVASLGHGARLASAPTARGALWLARAAVPPAPFRRALAALPVEHLGWPDRVVRALVQTGLSTVGDCLRLPREGFARRWGAGRLRELDEALGRSPEVFTVHVPATRFTASRELPAETREVTRLIAGATPLLAELGATLTARQAAVGRLWCRLGMADGTETRLCLVLRQPAGPDAAGRLPGLLRLRLEGLALSAPVTRLTLQADLEPAAAPAGTDLLGAALQPGDGLPALLDRLRARLGGPAVQGLALRAEHRPERAFCPVPEPGAGGSPATGLPRRPRPVWLLPEPRGLALVAGQPAWQGALCLEAGPERIESGWWDGGDIRRDYYRASNARGAMLWIYQDLRTRRWYLHGVFG